MNELATSANRGLASLQSLKTGLQNVTNTLPAKMGGVPILKIGKDGIWTYGADNVEVEEGSLWALNPFSLRHGYSCWTRWEDYGNKKRKDEIMGETLVSLNVPLPDVNTLRKYEVEGHQGEYWNYGELLAVDLMCVSGEDEGTTVVYKPSSVSGINAMRELIDKIMTQLGVDETKPVPVVELFADSYTHKKYGKVITPDIKIRKWSPLDKLDLGDETEEETVEEEVKEEAPAPATRRRAAAKPEPEPAGPDTGDAVEAVGETAAAAGQVRRRRRA
jgi:hypothetical protein